MSFYFPRQKIYITVPYKNGFTSALNFFVSVENLLESKQTQIKYLDSLEDLNIDHDFGVHSKTGEYSAEPFRLLATKSNLQKADIRFFIIRDPYKRFSSFWHNRIMNGPDPYFTKIYAALSSKYNLHNSEDVQNAAIEFLEDLAKPFTKTITNGHLWPQIYLTKGKRYDFITQTEDLAELPAILASKSPNYRAFKNHELPRLNISANSQFPLAWNNVMKKSFEKSYAADLLFYNGYKNGECETAEDIKSIQKESVQLINVYGNTLNTARILLKKLQIASGKLVSSN